MSSPTGIGKEKRVPSGRRKCSVIICYLDSLPALAYYLRWQSQHLFSFLCFLFFFFFFLLFRSSSNQIFLLVK